MSHILNNFIQSVYILIWLQTVWVDIPPLQQPWNNFYLNCQQDCLFWRDSFNFIKRLRVCRTIKVKEHLAELTDQENTREQVRKNMKVSYLVDPWDRLTRQADIAYLVTCQSFACSPKRAKRCFLSTVNGICLVNCWIGIRSSSSMNCMVKSKCISTLI